MRTFIDTCTCTKRPLGRAVQAFGVSIALTVGFGVASNAAQAGDLVPTPVRDTASVPSSGGGGLTLGAPSNDSCVNADAVTLGIGDSHTFTGNNENATHECASFPAGSGHVWIEITLLEDSSLSLEYCGSDGVWGNGWLNLALGCPCTGFTGAASFAFSCADGNLQMEWGSLEAGTYFYPIMTDAPNGSIGNYTITVTAGETQSNCCFAHGGIGCDDPDCQALICGQDAFCCDVSWDGLCAGAANDQCAVCQAEPDCGVAGTGNCCSANNTPFCDDGACCNLICGLDPFCCDTEWDSVCADAANDQCAVCDVPPVCGPGAGNCCAPNGSVGCEDEACCQAVCACDPFCCEVDWDNFCATTGFDPDCLCGPGTCGAANTPECDCETPELCPAGATGDCCIAHGQGTGCEDPDCCNLICGQDPFCCDVSWDGLCAGAAQTQCEVCLEDPACGVSGTGDCCVANNTPFCEDGECCDLICGLDPFCCDSSWDSICADAANDQCAVCDVPPVCGEGAGDCCSANGSVGCEDEACCEAVCACDPFCCEVDWDGFCSTTGFDPDCLCGPGTCGALNTPECECEFDDTDICCTAHGGIGCPADPPCEACVCGQDAFCCDVAWDGLCAGAAEGVCAGSCECADDVGPACPESDLSCCEAHPAGNPGCDDDECCELICAQDPFCCDVNWDGLCAGAANDQCEVCQLDPEGCSLGFWKNHAGKGPGNQPNLWVGYDPDDNFDEVFGGEAAPDSNCCENQCVPTCAGAGNPTGCDDQDCQDLICGLDPFCCNTGWDTLCSNAANANCDVCQAGAEPLGIFGDCSLHDVISSPSGGPNACADSPHLNNLGKQAVAALLNAASSVNYPLTEEEVLAAVSAALLGGDRGEIEDLKNELDALNNLGCPQTNQEDLSGPLGQPDGMVDTFDLIELLNHWGPVTDSRVADFNGDGVVDTFDLIILINNWGMASVEWVPHSPIPSLQKNQN